MSGTRLAKFVEAIRKTELVEQANLTQIAEWALWTGMTPDHLAKKIVKRNWLTVLQVKMLWKGKGPELFLNQYVLLEKLGEGGMGEVFKARHRRMDRDVALKIIRKERLANPDAIRRFEHEIRAAAQLAHENLVLAYDADRSGEQHFFVMEYVQGRNLTQLVQEDVNVSVRTACDIIRQAALGLQHAFERGMVHRDIKPSNLLVNAQGVVKILDMGLARLTDAAPGEPITRLTLEGVMVGTPDFVAPEQARNASLADIRSDIYSLGCTLYYLLAGQPPFPGGTLTEKVLRHALDPVPSLLRDDVPPELEAIYLRMMAKTPEKRYQTPAEVAQALQPYCGQQIPGVLPQPQPLTQTPKINSEFAISTNSQRAIRIEAKPGIYRSRNIVLVILLLLLIGGAAGGIYLWYPRSSNTSAAHEPVFTTKRGTKFILIQPARFEMGSPADEPGRQADEGPVHTVEITHAIYLGATEVTVREYQTIMGKLPKAYPHPLEKHEEEPVTYITRQEAIDFIKKLNVDPESQKPGWIYRLPTEAEWEYACRAGMKSRSQDHEIACAEAGLQGPAAVESYPANPWGLFGMRGNVAEWVHDRYDRDFYSRCQVKDPLNPPSTGKHVIRGGSWKDKAADCRCARRRGEFQELAFPDVGFRLALVLE